MKNIFSGKSRILSALLLAALFAFVLAGCSSGSPAADADSIITPAVIGAPSSETESPEASSGRSTAEASSETGTAAAASETESTASASVTTAPSASAEPESENSPAVSYKFRSSRLLNDHYQKHGKEMGFASPEAYEQAASDVINNPDALHKIEAEDGDDIYYVESTNEFVVLSTDGYIRTYFLPDSGIRYFNKQ